MAEDRIILGIDPGTNIMGYGILHVEQKKMSFLASGIIDLKKMDDPYSKLAKIFERTPYLVNEYKPDEVAIEAPFFGKNVQSMLKLGRAQGVAIAAAISRSVPIFEYQPRKIKQSITGNGDASKEQVAIMLQKLLNFKEMPHHLDATDGLAVAVCHYFQSNSPLTKNAKSFSGWKDFIAKNPDRLKK